jgi:hypothetical protein
MSPYSRVQFSDSVLLERAAINAARDHAHSAELLADLAEIDARKLYLPEACPSMLVYCVRELRYSEDEALKRIRVARVARVFPSIFDSVADGRLSLTAVVQLAPHLTSETTPAIAEDLIAAAAHKSKSEIQVMLAERFPRPDAPTRLEPVVGPSLTSDLLVPEPVDRPPAPRPASPDRVEPLSPGRYELQLTIDAETQALMREAQELLSHQIAPRDLAAIFKHALRVLVPALRKRKFAATDKPRTTCRQPNTPRHVPAHVKNAVWKRDGGQCTFVSESGKRCPARSMLEFDHVLEVARGGQATVGGMRLRCRAHNQFTAECTFGAQFMKQRREESRTPASRVPRATESSSSRAASLKMPETTIAAETAQAEDQDVVPWLRHLGFRADEARRAAEYCESIPEAPLEHRIRAALSFLRPRASYRKQPVMR